MLYGFPPNILAASVTVRLSGFMTSSKKTNPGCVGFLFIISLFSDSPYKNQLKQNRVSIEALFFASMICSIDCQSEPSSQLLNLFKREILISRSLFYSISL